MEKKKCSKCLGTGEVMVATNANNGITELVWSYIEEDKKLIWRYLIGFLAIVIALFIPDSKFGVVNIVLGILVSSLTLITLNSQRGYSKHSDKFRQGIKKTTINVPYFTALISLGAVILFIANAISKAVFITFNFEQEFALTTENMVFIPVIMEWVVTLWLIIHIYNSFGAKSHALSFYKSITNYLFGQEPFAEKEQLRPAFFEISIIVISGVYLYGVAKLFDIIFSYFHFEIGSLL
jgi:hypothetical protein